MRERCSPKANSTGKCMNDILAMNRFGWEDIDRVENGNIIVCKHSLQKGERSCQVKVTHGTRATAGLIANKQQAHLLALAYLS